MRYSPFTQARIGRVDAVEPEKRIGDRQRREVDATLLAAHNDGVLTLTEYDERVAQCWAARTQPELDALTADLPTPQAQPVTLEKPATAQPARAVSPDRSPRRIFRGIAAIALVAATGYGGTQIVTADDGATVFGSREVHVTAGDPEVEVAMLFGQVRVVVPDGVRARTAGTVVFGSVECGPACSGPATGPEITVDANGAFGSVDVVTVSENATRPSRDDDRDE
jgi:hypothetical protein